MIYLEKTKRDDARVTARAVSLFLSLALLSYLWKRKGEREGPNTVKMSGARGEEKAG